MILVSCRKHFDSNELFAGVRARRYPRLSDTTTFTDMTERDLLDAIRDMQVLVLVHGYRNPLQDVAAAYGKVESELTKRGLIGAGNYDLALGFLWPGFQTQIGFLAAVPWANRSASYFREFLKTLNSAAHAVDVQTHSLGARVALQAMAFAHEVSVDNLLLTAAAVDDESLEPTKEFNGSLVSCRRAFVYYSSNDSVLKYGYRIGAVDRALGYKGPEHPDVIARECPNVFVVDCSAVIASHGGYRQSGEIYDEWAEVLSGQRLPRSETLTKTAIVRSLISRDDFGRRRSLDLRCKVNRVDWAQCVRARWCSGSSGSQRG